MGRRGGQAFALAVALTAGLLVAGGAADAAPPTAAPTTPAAVGRPFHAGPTAAARAVAAATAGAAAFGAQGTVVVLVQPLRTAPASGQAVAGSAAGTSPVGAVDRVFPTASLVKLYLAEGVLALARSARTALPAEDLARIEAMLTSSDDQAASELWVAYDGPTVLAGVVARFGLTGTAAPAPDPGAWGSTTTTAGDLSRFLTGLDTVAHPDDAAVVRGALSRATPVGADGFDQSFGLLAPGGTGVAAKQGWMCCTADLRHLHSVGFQGDRVVVLLAEFPAAVDWPTARAALDGAAAGVTATYATGRSATSVVPMRANPTRS